MKQIRSRAPRKMGPTNWQNLKKGVRALKLWRSTGPRLPQIAILLLPSSEQYEAFLKNPTGYVNRLKIFGPKGTRKVIGCHLARKKAGTLYAVILKHEMDCTSLAISSSSVTL